MIELDTLPEPEGCHRESSASSSNGFGLVIVWANQPNLIGRTYVVPSAPRHVTHIIGRGDEPREDAHVRLLAIEDRPGGEATGRVLESQLISRVQLVIRPLLGQSIGVQNVGQCRLLHNGEEKTVAEVRAGDTLALGRQLLLLCVERQRAETSPPLGFAPPPFGDADAWGAVGESAASWTLRRQIANAAARKEHVLIVGDSGTGKEIVARAIHAQSNRSHRPLIARNAAAFPESLIDAELFGNAKNYPNPGMPDRAGLFGQAHGATLFLDEIAEMPVVVQSHLLRVLDAGEYQKLGESTTRHSDFRLLGATNRPELLREDVAARFKLLIAIPGLSERREDIPLLVRHLLRKIASEPGSRAERFFPDGDLTREPVVSQDLITSLLKRPYTTHVRELERILWQAVDGSGGGVLEFDRLERDNGHSRRTRSTVGGELLVPKSEAPPSKAEILRALEDNDWVVQRTWQTLGLRSRHALNRLITRFGIKRSERPTPPI